MTKTKDADANLRCGKLEKAIGTDVLDARCISYIDADAEQARKYAVRPRPVAPIVEVD